MELAGERSGTAVSLKWTLTRWPDGLQGFTVRRRPLGSDGAWSPVTRGVLVPGLFPQRDLSLGEPDDKARAALARRLTQVLEPGRLKVVPPDRFVAEAREDGDRFFAELRMVLHDDPELAHLYGFACTDRDVAPGTDFEYGLFPAPEAAPLAVFKALSIPKDAPDLKAAELEVLRVPDGAWLRWGLPEAAVRDRGVAGYYVYRAPGQNGPFTQLTPRPLRSKHAEDGFLRFAYLDASAKPGTSYVYAVAPAGALGGELPVRTTVATGPDRPASELPAPKISGVSRGPGGRQIVAWQFPKNLESRITGFCIEAGPFPEGPTDAFPETAAPDVREAADPQERKSEVGYVYLVSAMSGTQVLSRSAPFFLLSIDSPRPPKPTGLRAAPLERNGVPGILLTWDPKSAGDFLTEGYVLYADHPKEGELTLQASIPLIRESPYFFSMDLAAGRVFMLGIAAVGKGGGESERIETKAYLAGLLPPEVKGIKVARERDASLAVTWDYPPEPVLRGFRIYQGAELVADESVLSPAARRWTLEAIDPRVQYVYTVRAVSLAGGLSPLASAALLPEKTEAAPPPPPAGLSAKRAKQGEQHVIEITWTPAPLQHWLAVDLPDLGTFPPATLIPSTPPGKYVLPVDDPRRTVTLRLVAARKDGGTSVPAEIVVPGEGRTLPPALLQDTFSLEPSEGGVVARWSWRYPPVEGLAGFRIYKDGAESPVADEKTLGPDARAWTSGVLVPRIKHVFQIEAVGAEGETSERGPARTVLHFRR